MRVVGWADLELPSDAWLEHFDPWARPDPASRLRRVQRTPPTIPPGLAHHGIGGDVLAERLATHLVQPRFLECDRAVLVPFRLRSHPRDPAGALDILVASAVALQSAWPANRDPAYAQAVSDARKAVQRGAPSADEHALWLEHFLVEQLIPTAVNLTVPVVIDWPDRREAQPTTPDATWSARLDAALRAWED